MMTLNSDISAVTDVVKHYLMGISDTSVASNSIQAAFYSSTNLHCVNEGGELQFQARDSLIQTVLDGGVPTHSSEILDIEVISDMALAKVHLDMPDRHFYDYLTLLKLNVGWKIVSKTYTTVMKQ